jgi:prepilin-type N-terminal cleavage/methylation domain-containing protein
MGYKKGFSLIELIVMIAVMGLLAGGAVVFINRFNAQQKFTSSVEKTIIQLRLARNYAVTLQTPKDDGNLTAVEVTISGGMMRARALYGADVQEYFNVKVVEDGITVVPSGTIRFAPVTGKLLGSDYKIGSAADITIDFSSPELSIVGGTKIRISKSGIISEM